MAQVLQHGSSAQFAGVSSAGAGSVSNFVQVAILRSLHSASQPLASFPDFTLAGRPGAPGFRAQGWSANVPAGSRPPPSGRH
jgi:hypothetical protein